MVHEDQATPRCSNSSKTSSGNSKIGKSCKKQRRKKVPQRGLGVAQLEKIRLEEQQKKDSVCLIAADVSASCSVACNGNTSGTVPLTSVDGHKFWGSCECFGLDPGWGFSTKLGLPCEIEPVWPLPSLMPRGQQPYSSMVNLSSRTSTSTSVMNFQMEPPSNQSFYKNFKPFLPEEEKVIGMKRPYPFSLGNAQGPSFHTKCYGQFEATSSTSKATTFDSESGSSNFREGPSCSTTNGVSARGFLTLAPPTTTSKCSDLDSLAYHQVNFEDSSMKQVGSGSNLQRPYYSFFPPPAMAQIEGSSAATMANCKREEVVGHVDLNLKL
ncbi:hypothetical protein V6N13_129139 [Hibiscus sabdariffa]|uniref:Uncharacterized protein n=1 Tax=Hibiscus sabdariffa TaxID=183260 RepID=A0ABR2SL65_9ROSI